MSASMARRLRPGPRGPWTRPRGGRRGQARRAAVRPELDGLPRRPGGLRPAAPGPGPWALGSRASRPGAAPPAPWSCQTRRPTAGPAVHPAGALRAHRAGGHRRGRRRGLLVLARDGDRARLGPRSLGPASRFVVDQAPRPVLLVWPELAPGIATIRPRLLIRRTTGRCRSATALIPSRAARPVTRGQRRDRAPQHGQRSRFWAPSRRGAASVLGQ
jgi:hypothetical protein